MTKKISPETLDRLEKVSEALRPSREEVLRKYGPLLEQWQAERQRERRPSLEQKLQELWKGVSIRVMEGMREFEAGLAGFSGAQAYVTRGASRSAQAAKSEHVFIQDGKDCCGRVAIRPAAAGKVSLELSLRDKQLRPLKHFFVTVRDAKGKDLVSRSEVNKSYHLLSDMALVDCVITLESPDGRQFVRMGWEIGK